jgi:hypothetical protein
MLPTDGKPKKRVLNVLLRHVTSLVDAHGLLFDGRQSIVSLALLDAPLVTISALSRSGNRPIGVMSCIAGRSQRNAVA